MKNFIFKLLVTIFAITLCLGIFTACNGEQTPPHTHDHQTLKNNNSSHWLECECGDKINIEYHRGGTATCTEKSKCEVCNEVYGGFEDHKYLTYSYNNDATCTADGTETAYCEFGCGESNIRVKTNSKLPHEYKTLKKDSENHWYECECGAKNGVKEHKPGAIATETTDQKCTICNYVITPSLGHIHTLHLTKVGAKSQSCTQEGNIEYYICSCNKWFLDNTATTEILDKSSVVIEKSAHEYKTLVYNTENHWKQCKCGAKQGVEEHKGGTATETQKAKCEICYKEYGSLLPHTHVYNTTLSNETAHWYECKCGDIQGIEAHNGGVATCMALAKCIVCSTSYGELGDHQYSEVITEPTCEDKGYTTYTCECGDSYIDSYVNELGHGTAIDGVLSCEPTCTMQGYLHKICSVCHKTLQESTIEVLGHEYNSVVTKPTCEDKGYTTYSCSRCNDSYVDNYVDALGHNFEDYICSECGYTQGLKFTLKNNTEYSVSGYVGNSAEVVIPKNYLGKPVTSIGSDAFYCCDSLISVIIGDNVTSIDSDAFLCCSKLKSIKIPNSVTSIGSGAFWDCDSLESIVIPNSVTSIGYGVLSWCESLVTIYCEAESKPSGWDKQWNLDDEDIYHKVVWGYKGENN